VIYRVRLVLCTNVQRPFGIENDAFKNDNSKLVADRLLGCDTIEILTKTVQVTTEGRSQLRNVKRAPSPYVMEQKVGRDSSSRPILDELI
jgi:hypothetical protein